jgi:transposase
LLKNALVVKFVEVSFPKMSMQYGSNVESLVSYFSVRQYLPFKRMKECFSDVFGLNLSQGSIANMLSKFAKKAHPIYQRIKANVSISDVIGVDETLR